MPTLTGHQVFALALERLAGGSAAKLVKVLRLRNVRDAEHLADQVSKWAKEDGPEPGFDVILPALDALGAINWDVIFPPVSAEERGALAQQAARTAAGQDDQSERAAS